jgi:large subunit ribosomal protein L15
MLNTLNSPKSKQKTTQIGRGTSSGRGGHTVGRGGKGATARSGFQYPRRNFEGGQNPLSRRLPKYRGFTRGFFKARTQVFALQLSRLANKMEKLGKTEVTVAALLEDKMIDLKSSKRQHVKILFDHDINYKLTVKGIKVSETAKAAIVKAGGSVE